ncbi:MAG: ECF transporter S component [Oscillospiraceae bacterium]|nr:ECF transporter S component [Oscillospiraceae bacterium]
MKSYYAKFVTRTAVLLALCVAVQQFKSLSQFITGPLVNAILIIAALAVGLWSGIAIAVLSPVLAFLISPSPIMQAVPQLIPVIMVGNAIIVVCVYVLRNQKYWWAGLALGSVLKAGFLALAVKAFIIPTFGGNLVEKQITALGLMFSYNQLITAAIGSVIAGLLWLRLHKVQDFALTK